MTAISTPNAPQAIGPYSQARIYQGLLYVSGQLPIDPKSGRIESEDPVEQMKQCLKNIEAIAQKAGATLADVLKTSVLVTRLSEFPEINKAYSEFFTAPFPARATFEVSALPMNALVEVDAVVALNPAA